MLAAGDSYPGRIKSLQLPWRTVESGSQAPGGLLLVARAASGGVRAQRRFDAASIAAVAAALRRGRAEVEAMVADYQRRCVPAVEQIIVT